MGRSKSQCFVRKTSSTLLFVQACNEEESIVYEDFTTNHNKSLIGIEPGNNPDACTLQLIIVTDQEELVRMFPPSNRGVFIEVENLREIRANCIGEGTINACSANISIERDFCICCNVHSCRR
jgi:diacylglycerol kinase family enzyme